MRWFICLWGLFILSACSHPERKSVDRLNNISYDFLYQDLDSAEVYAMLAYTSADGFRDGKAEAANNMAIAKVIRMEYDTALRLTASVYGLTDNQIELLMADALQMHICQRKSLNKEFYDHRQQALERMGRIEEERAALHPRQRQRLAYAEMQFAVASSEYFLNVGLDSLATQALKDIQSNVAGDSSHALRLAHLYALAKATAGDASADGAQQRFEWLTACFLLAREHGYTYFEGASLQSIAELLLDPARREKLLADNPQGAMLINPDGYLPEDLPAALAADALSILQGYGARYETACALRTLASWCVWQEDYDEALNCLETAMADTLISQSPSLMASICEQMCVAYSGLGDKQASDHNRNIYLDLQELSRQDRYFESRAQMYARASAQLGAAIAAVMCAIALLLTMLWFFARLHRRRTPQKAIDSLLQPLREWQEQNERNEAVFEEQCETVGEQLAAGRADVSRGEWRNLENRAKVSLASSVTPLIGRLAGELDMLVERDERPDVRRERYDYVAELAAEIESRYSVLTQWIQMRQGLLTLHIETFALEPLFDIVAKSRIEFADKGIELQVKPTDLWVKADKALTLFMVNTIAENARKFTNAGGSVSIEADDGGEYVEISVTDTGIGIAADRLPHIFDYKACDGHGFGLVNCRGIIDKYRTSSHIFSVCSIKAESREGHGSRFSFRLPKGVRRALAIAALLATTICSANAQNALDTAQDTALSTAKAYADSAFFSNVAGTYSRTVALADSCLRCLNDHYRKVRPNGNDTLTIHGDLAPTPTEVLWLADSVPTNYSIILDVRNESAVAALALHDWRLYDYNNKAYTQLYKALSADHTLADHCRAMQQSQANKTIAIVLLVIILVAILPAYYMLYYRHRIYFRFCVDRVKAVNAVLLSDDAPEAKLASVRRIAAEPFPKSLQAVVDKICSALEEASQRRLRQNVDLELAHDEVRRTEQESAALHVANAVLDNCLSSLKHETTHFPSRIAQLVRGGDANLQAMRELTVYWRDVYSLLCLRAARQQDRVRPRMTAVAVSDIIGGTDSGLRIVGNLTLLRSMFAMLRRQAGCGPIEAHTMEGDTRYIVFTTTLERPQYNEAASLFAPKVENIPMLLCRQVVRDHSEATRRRRCGIVAHQAPDRVTIEITLAACRPLPPGDSE